MDGLPAREQITLDAVFAAAWRKRWVMIACVVACAALAARPASASGGDSQAFPG
jgi:uncharacterized protein involved in exopolysaccharide biosynthesis